VRFDEKKERNEEEKEKKELSESRERDKKKIFRVYKIPRPRRPPVLALALASLHIADKFLLSERTRKSAQERRSRV
jgi:hypothetical protein